MTSAIALTELEERVAQRITPEGSRAVGVSMRAGGIVFDNLEQMMDFAKAMAIGGIAVPKHLRGNVGACLAVTIQAVEWNFSPFAVANKSYSVNDRLAYESQLIQAVILSRAPIVGRMIFEFDGDGMDRTCTAKAQLTSLQWVTYTSPRVREIKVKNSPLWTADPDQQLTYYSGRALCRRYFPDILLGIFSQDELAEVVEGERINPLQDDIVTDYSETSDASAERIPAEGGEEGVAGTPQDAAPSEPAAEPSAAYTAGRSAAASKLARDACPIPGGKRTAAAREDWLRGYDEAIAEGGE